MSSLYCAHTTPHPTIPHHVPADDPLDEDGDGDGEDGEADRQLVEKRHSSEQVSSGQAHPLYTQHKG